MDERAPGKREDLPQERRPLPAVDTGHADECVCYSCSSMREECKWPESERYGHNWLTVRGNLVSCEHCGERGYFGIRESAARPGENAKRIATVVLGDA